VLSRGLCRDRATARRRQSSGSAKALALPTVGGLRRFLWMAEAAAVEQHLVSLSPGQVGKAGRRGRALKGEEPVSIDSRKPVKISSNSSPRMLLTGYRQTLSTRPTTLIWRLPWQDDPAYQAALFCAIAAGVPSGYRVITPSCVGPRCVTSPPLSASVSVAGDRQRQRPYADRVPPWRFSGLAPFANGNSRARLGFRAAIKSITGAGVATARGFRQLLNLGLNGFSQGVLVAVPEFARVGCPAR